MRKFKFIASVFIVGLALTSCINDDEGIEPDDTSGTNRGTIEANRLKITFYPTTNTTQRSTYEFYDPDGVGGAAPTINEKIMLDYPVGSFLEYVAEIELFNNNDTVTDAIKNLETKYIICHRGVNDDNLRLISFDKDSNGKKLGLRTEWVTVDDRDRPNPTDGKGSIRITLNFQNAVKEGLCDSGIRIFDATMNYEMN